MEKRLILKAEDRGNEEGVLRGIDALLERGLLTDVSCIIQFTGEKEKDLLLTAIDKSPLKDKPGVGILLHANFVTGSPVSGLDRVPSLVNGEVFKRPNVTTISAWKEYAKYIDVTDFHKELDAQINLFYSRFNHYPHALCAHNMNLWYPEKAAQITLDTASQLSIPIVNPRLYTDRTTEGPFNEIFRVDRKIREQAKERGIPTADHVNLRYWSTSERLQESINRFLKSLGSLRSGVTEFFLHPAHPDFTSPDPRYERGRVRDFKMLTDPRVVGKLGTIALTSYKELFNQLQNRKLKKDYR